MTTSKNTVTRGTYSSTQPAKASHLHLVPDTRTCACGKEIVGNHKTCGQCNLLRQAEFRGQELHACANNCGALTPFVYCWHCNRMQTAAPVQAKPETTSTPSRKCKMPECFCLKLIDRLLCRAHADEADRKFLSDETSKLAPKAESNVGRCTKCGHKTLAPEYPLCVSCHKQQFAPPPPPHAVAPTNDQQVEAEFRKMVETAYERGGVKAVEEEFFGMAKVKELSNGQYTVLIAGKSFTFFSAKAAASAKELLAVIAKEAEALTQRKAEAALAKAKELAEQKTHHSELLAAYRSGKLPADIVAEQRDVNVAFLLEDGTVLDFEDPALVVAKVRAESKKGKK